MLPTSPITGARLARTAIPLANKIAVVTGASRGIGLAIAHRLSQDGATCLLVGRDEQRLTQAIEELTPPQSSSGKDDKHSFLVGDVRHMRTWFAIQQQAPRVDILVNAAGVSQRSLLINTQLNEIQSILETNLQSAIVGCKSVGRQMIRTKSHGVIVNVSSLMAVQGGHGAAVYAASKAGLIGLTRALVNEMKPFFIRANVVLPGYITTEMTEGKFPFEQYFEMVSAISSQMPRANPSP